MSRSRPSPSMTTQSTVSAGVLDNGMRSPKPARVRAARAARKSLRSSYALQSVVVLGEGRAIIEDGAIGSEPQQVGDVVGHARARDQPRLGTNLFNLGFGRLGLARPEPPLPGELSRLRPTPSAGARDDADPTLDHAHADFLGRCPWTVSLAD